MNMTEAQVALEHLPERYADRLPEQDRRDAAEFRDAGEWGELVELLVASLHATQAPISAAERDELRRLMQTMRVSTGELAKLRVAA